MDLDDQLRRYFGTADTASISPAVLEAGTEHMKVDFGLEKDQARRFALWALLYMLGTAPDLETAFEDEADRDAARNFMDLTDAAVEQGEGDGARPAHRPI